MVRLKQLPKGIFKTSQEGVGLLEVLISMIVLGFMVTILSKYQFDNRAAIQLSKQRNGAMQLAENVLDSLQMAGIHQVSSTAFEVDKVDLTSDFGAVFNVTAVVSDLDVVFSSGTVVSKKIILSVNWARPAGPDSASVVVEGVIQ